MRWLNESWRVACREIVLLVRVKCGQLFHILSIEVSRNICVNCLAHSNYKVPKVGRYGETGMGTGATNIWVRILISLLLIVGPWVLATTSQNLSFPIYKMETMTIIIIKIVNS